jgi:hypothetical protein
VIGGWGIRFSSRFSSFPKTFRAVFRKSSKKHFLFTFSRKLLPRTAEIRQKDTESAGKTTQIRNRFSFSRLFTANLPGVATNPHRSQCSVVNLARNG